jgi:hypothetical protein
MGVQDEISGEMGRIAETGSHEGTSLQLGPTPHPTSWGGSPTPRRMLTVPPRWVGEHRRAYRASGMGGQNGVM